MIIILLLQRPHSVRRERDQHLHAGLCAEELLRGVQYQVTADRWIYSLSFLTLYSYLLPQVSPDPESSTKRGGPEGRTACPRVHQLGGGGGGGRHLGQLEKED